MDAMIEQLLIVTKHEQLLILSEKEGKYAQLNGKMDHLVCFVPGLFLGIHTITNTTLMTYEKMKHKLVAELLLETCLIGYNRTRTKLAPEIYHFDLKHSNYQQLYCNKT